MAQQAQKNKTAHGHITHKISACRHRKHLGVKSRFNKPSQANKLFQRHPLT